jgi:hypothetical protein
MVSDRRLLSWFDSYSRETLSFKKYLSNPIQSLSLPSINLNAAVIAAESSATILDAMKLMSEGGVSSIAVVEENHGTLLSAVSVTDIGKASHFQTLIHGSGINFLFLVCRSFTEQANFDDTSALFYRKNKGTYYSYDIASHLSVLNEFKEPDGSTDGADKYPGGFLRIHSTNNASDFILQYIQFFHPVFYHTRLKSYLPVSFSPLYCFSACELTLTFKPMHIVFL